MQTHDESRTRFSTPIYDFDQEEDSLESSSCANSVGDSEQDTAQEENRKIASHPDGKPISYEQLVAEVKFIYAGLVRVES